MESSREKVARFWAVFLLQRDCKCAILIVERGTFKVQKRK